MSHQGSLTKLDRVIAVVEPGAEHQTALDRVAWLAKRVDFELMLVASDFSQYLVEGYYFSETQLPELREQYLAERRELLEALAKPLREGGIDVTTRAIWSHPPYKAVTELAEEYQPDLVIHHVKRHAALSRMMLTSNDWQMARHCAAPLLMVKEKPWRDTPFFLAAVDPMHARHKPGGLDHQILETTEFLAAKLGGNAGAAHAYGQFPLSGLYPDDAEKQHKSAFVKLMQDFSVVDEQQYLLDEAPEFALQSIESELQMDVIVMGSLSRSLIKDLLIGSTTEKVLDLLDCDALLLRPQE